MAPLFESVLNAANLIVPQMRKLRPQIGIPIKELHYFAEWSFEYAAIKNY